MAENQNAYAIVGIHKGASEKDIKNCYINLVKKYDPERHTERFMVIQAAYEKLRQPKTRAKEDVFTFNPAMGEYLYNDSEKSDGAAPAEIDISRARRTAASMLGLLPEVLMATRTSPGRPCALT